MWITKQKHRLILAAVSVVAGCASLPANVKPLDTDTYQLSVTGTRYQSQADTNFKAFTAANDYCGSLGKQMLFRNSTEVGEHVYSPKQEDLVFVCTDPNAPGYQRASVKRNQAVAANQ